MKCKEDKVPKPDSCGICSICKPHLSCRQCNDCGRFRPRQVLETYEIGNPGDGIRGYRCIQCSCRRDPEFGKIKVDFTMHVAR